MASLNRLSFGIEASCAGGFEKSHATSDPRTELVFEEGMLRQETDRSAQMAALRSHLASRPLSPTTLEERADIEQWVSQSFSQEL